MNQNFSQLLRVVFAVVDLVMLNLVFFFTRYLFRHTIAVEISSEYLYFAIFSNVFWLGSSALYNIYHAKNTSSFEAFVKRTTRAYFLFLIAALLYLYFRREIHVSRTFTIIFLTAFPVCLFISRLGYLFAYLYFRKKESLLKRVLIVGHNDIARKLAGYLEIQGEHMQIIGFCEEAHKVAQLSHYPILGTPANAMQISAEYNVNEIYSTILPEQDNRIYKLMEEADRAYIRFRLVPDFTYFVKRPMHVNYLADIPVLSPRSEPLDDLANRIKKRAIDIAVSLLVCILLLSWLIPIISLLIWLESGSPVFFVQKRSGVNNKPFKCLKFRSMKINNEAHTTQAIKNDQRLTRVGKFLRKTNLDEFPQFFNVLVGNMSIVGPRPHMLKHTEDYSKMYPQYMVRQFLKPGITGWAQVQGYRGEIRSVEDIENRVQHDIWYMENWTQWLDFKIMFLTFYTMIKGDTNAF